MRGYFYSLLAASVCTSLCSMLVSGGFEKYIKYLASLICVAVMVSPLRQIDFSETINKAESELSMIDTDNGLFYETAGEITEKRSEEYINQIVFNQFGIKPRSTHIEIDWGKEEPVIENIKVCLSPEDLDEGDRVKTYLFNILGGEVEIVEG